MQDCSENSTLLGATPRTQNIEDMISCLLVLIACRSKQIILQWGKPQLQNAKHHLYLMMTLMRSKTEDEVQSLLGCTAV
jgi:hypothetical protein